MLLKVAEELKPSEELCLADAQRLMLRSAMGLLGAVT